MLDKVARALPQDRVSTCSGDVSEYKDIERMVDTALNFSGKLDVVVNNAGIDPGGTVVDIRPRGLEKGDRHQSDRPFPGDEGFPAAY